MLAKDVIDAAAETLLDEGNVRWPRTTLLRYLNQAQRALAGVKPDVCTDVVDIELVEGIRQRLQSPGLRLLDVIRNAGGGAITLVSRETMNDLRAAWMMARPGRSIVHYCADENSPADFLVYPPAQAGLTVTVQRTRLPVDCADETASIGVADIYETPLIDFVCYRAYLRDAESQGSQGKAMAHYQAFVAAMGSKAASDSKSKPQSLYPNKVVPSTQ